MEYDITDFKHPGGSVIHSMTEGQDATIAFQEFHYRSKTAGRILNSLPNIKLEKNKENDKDADMLDDFIQFRKSLENRGYFDPNYIHVSFRIFEILGIYFIAAYTIKYNIMLSILLFGLCGGRCGWLQHECGHNSFTCNIKIDKRIQQIFLGFFAFGDASVWNSMHNKHHATPQKIGYDIDLDTAPLVSFYNNSIENRSYFAKLWLRYQAYTFLPITSGLFVMPFWTFYLHPRKVMYDKNLLQAIFMASGHAIRVFLYMKIRPTSVVYALFYHFMAIWATGIYLFGHFSLSHTFTPTVDRHDNPNWVRYAIEHTVDISPDNPFVCWFMGYLNNQVIHHLFPSMPQYRGSEISKELILFCKKWDIKYNIMSYYDAWAHMLHNLNTVGQALSNE